MATKAQYILQKITATLICDNIPAVCKESIQ